MVSIKSLVFSTALLVASASAASIEKRGGGWGTATYYYQNGNPVRLAICPLQFTLLTKQTGCMRQLRIRLRLRCSIELC